MKCRFKGCLSLFVRYLFIKQYLEYIGVGERGLEQEGVEVIRKKKGVKIRREVESVQKGFELILFDFFCLYCFWEGLYLGVKIKNKDFVYLELLYWSKSEKGVLGKRKLL